MPMNRRLDWATSVSKGPSCSPERVKSKRTAVGTAREIMRGDDGRLVGPRSRAVVRSPSVSCDRERGAGVRVLPTIAVDSHRPCDQGTHDGPARPYKAEDGGSSPPSRRMTRLSWKLVVASCWIIRSRCDSYG
jgi:hypothetical protein